MTNSNPNTPYSNLPPQAFWRSAVTRQEANTVGRIHTPKFAIERSTNVAMAGSCFAQQLSRHLRARGFSVLDKEPPPPGLTPEEEAHYGFNLYSARYGNIYTARQLRLLAEEAFGSFAPGNAVWEKDGKFYDALRPSVEPAGLGSGRAVKEQRKFHLRKVREVISVADVFVFTLGLTEAWVHEKTGTVFPIAPGVICGSYDPEQHRFQNFTAQEVYADLAAFFALAKTHNPNMKLLLTVSPQRPVATASDKHILVAAGYSKAALRAAAGQLETEHLDVDYFPSYEIVTSPLAGNCYFNENLRTVSDEGANAVMDAFFAAYGGGEQVTPTQAPTTETVTHEEAICDEELLEAFSR